MLAGERQQHMSDVNSEESRDDNVRGKTDTIGCAPGETCIYTRGDQVLQSLQLSASHLELDLWRMVSCTVPSHHSLLDLVSQ